MGSNVMIMQCPECGKRFTDSRAYGGHRAMSHGALERRRLAAAGGVDSYISPLVPPPRIKAAPEDTLADRLLSQLFPQSRIPAAAVDATREWLEEAARLAAVPR